METLTFGVAILKGVHRVRLHGRGRRDDRGRLIFIRGVDEWQQCGPRSNRPRINPVFWNGRTFCGGRGDAIVVGDRGRRQDHLRRILGRVVGQKGRVVGVERGVGHRGGGRRGRYADHARLRIGNGVVRGVVRRVWRLRCFDRAGVGVGDGAVRGDRRRLGGHLERRLRLVVLLVVRRRDGLRSQRLRTNDVVRGVRIVRDGAGRAVVLLLRLLGGRAADGHEHVLPIADGDRRLGDVHRRRNVIGWR